MSIRRDEPGLPPLTQPAYSSNVPGASQQYPYGTERPTEPVCVNIVQYRNVRHMFNQEILAHSATKEHLAFEKQERANADRSLRDAVSRLAQLQSALDDANGANLEFHSVLAIEREEISKLRAENKQLCERTKSQHPSSQVRARGQQSEKGPTTDDTTFDLVPAQPSKGRNLKRKLSQQNGAAELNDVPPEDKVLRTGKASLHFVVADQNEGAKIDSWCGGGADAPEAHGEGSEALGDDTNAVQSFKEYLHVD